MEHPLYENFTNDTNKWLFCVSIPNNWLGNSFINKSFADVQTFKVIVIMETEYVTLLQITYT